MANLKGAFLQDDNLSLATDLYELTMAAGYFAAGKKEVAVFELFVRSLPENRGYLVACGLEQALHGILSLRFSGQQVSYLKSVPALRTAPREFFDALTDLRFSGEVCAVPEGTVVFAGEPVLRVRAPIIEAQILETYLLSQINFQTMIASKTARIVQAARGRPVVEFGSRRAHGPGAAVLAARASYIAGCAGTSNLLVGQLFGIPVYGTTAHSWTMSWDCEEESFQRYRDVFPDGVLLIDTYDTIAGARRAGATGPGLGGVRLDSGDLVSLSKEVRKVLRESGQEQARIVASGDLDEYMIAELLDAGAQIDSFGVGTKLATSYDAPALGGAYKLVEAGGRPALKSSEGKESYPGPKQVFRFTSDAGLFERDLIAHVNEDPGGEPLLVRHIQDGRIAGEYPSIEEIRKRASEQLAALPEGLKRLRSPELYHVEISETLREMRNEASSTQH